MRIAVVSTINLPTPPVGYGGIERLVHIFVEELIRQGHDVTMFAREGSHCSGRTVGVALEGRTSGGRVRLSEEGLHKALEEYVAAERPDVVHDWSLDNLFVNRFPHATPFVVSTCVPQPDSYAQRNVVAASAAHAATLKGGRVPFVRFGVDVDRLAFSPAGGRRLAHVAKIARYKAQHLSMLGAALAGMPLDVVGNVEGQRYAKYVVRPLGAVLPGVRLTGESLDVDATLRGALALVLTPRWFETFPLISLQSLAAGTPVVTLGTGGLPEQIEQGVNGFVAQRWSELVLYLGQVHQISRQACRDTAMERFHVSRMVREYVEIYQRVRDGETW
jgi:glycosyltransferase involved in cell wall biosynthesis